ncbi:hypothetical protein [Actinomadura hibisca]|uniref:hypothetical protein n=1 Tax=Actinomadura hibisca TaxID=68565 RepID=UPI00082EBE68|nr:hypothetical protein [Actinomadura hibisca]
MPTALTFTSLNDLFTGKDLTTTNRVFRLNEADDRDLASDRVSRYGAYLRNRRHLFADFDDDNVLTTDPVDFARTAWETATSPIMSPPYLQWTCERIRDVLPRVSDHDGSLIFGVELAMPRPSQLRAVYGFGEWDRHGGYFFPEDRALAHGPVMLTSTTLLFQVPTVVLPAPAAESGSPDTPETVAAKKAVARLAEWLDAALAPALAALSVSAGDAR